MRVWAVVVAAGSGSRFGKPKQFEVPRRSPDSRLVGRGRARRSCDDVVTVLAAVGERRRGGRRDTQRVGARRAGRGARRTPSIIVVHDAARPLASAALFEAVIAAVRAGPTRRSPAFR